MGISFSQAEELLKERKAKTGQTFDFETANDPRLKVNAKFAQDQVMTLIPEIFEYLPAEDKFDKILSDPIFRKIKFDLRDPDVPFHLKLAGANKFTLEQTGHSLNWSPTGPCWACFDKSEEEKVIYTDPDTGIQSEHYQRQFKNIVFDNKHPTLFNQTFQKPSILSEWQPQDSTLNDNVSVTFTNSVLTFRSTIKTDGGQLVSPQISVNDQKLILTLRIDLSGTTKADEITTPDNGDFPAPKTRRVDSNGKIFWEMKCRGEIWMKFSPDDKRLTQDADYLEYSILFCTIRVAEEDFDPRLIQSGRKSRVNKNADDEKVNDVQVDSDSHSADS